MYRFEICCTVDVGLTEAGAVASRNTGLMNKLISINPRIWI